MSPITQLENIGLSDWTIPLDPPIELNNPLFLGRRVSWVVVHPVNLGFFRLPARCARCDLEKFLCDGCTPWNYIQPSHLKMDGWNTIVSFSGWPIFRGEMAVSFREGLAVAVRVKVKKSWWSQSRIKSLPFSFQWSWLQKNHWLEDFMQKKNSYLHCFQHYRTSCHVSISPHPTIASTNTKGMKRKRIRRNVPPAGRYMLVPKSSIKILPKLQPCNSTKTWPTKKKLRSIPTSKQTGNTG